MYIPSRLAPGNYLIRHEIISLQFANETRRAEFYPACAQLRVGGSETGGPTFNELVSLPGAYDDGDPGLYNPNGFINTTFEYKFPGPPVAAFVSELAQGTALVTDPILSPIPTSTTSGSGIGIDWSFLHTADCMAIILICIGIYFR